MFGSGSRPTTGRRMVGAVLVTMVVWWGAGASSAPAANGSTGNATGTAVKVGLITTGSCDGCTGQAEQPVAQAATKWLNQTQNGLAGHQIVLDVCIDHNDPGTASDCANQMIRDGVVAVIEGSDGVLGTTWPILHSAAIPLINHSATNDNVIKDTQSTFILYDPLAQTVTLPIAVAKEKHATKVSVIVVDYPTATDIYKSAADRFKQAGITLTVVPVALGVADMTSQAQQIEMKNPGGVVSVVGAGAFCISAFNALHAVGFHGTITTISFCITNDLPKSVPGSVLNGMQFGAEAPFGDKTDSSMREYASILKKYAPTAVDPADQPGLVVFQSVAALAVGAKGLQGDVTPKSVTAALKGMPNEVLPASGGRLFRCNGKASTFGAATCSAATSISSLDANGNPKKYQVTNNSPIPG